MIASLGGAIVLALLILLPGYVIYRAVGPAAPADPAAPAASPIEPAGVVAAWGVLLTGWLSFVLVEIGWLSLPALALLVGLLSAGLAGVARRRGRSLRPGRARWTAADLAFLAAALLVLALALRPHQTILGGTDAGVYANTGASIARTGRLLIQDDVTASLAPSARGPRAQIDTPDDAPSAAEGAIRHLMLRLPEGRFPFADYLRLAGFYVLDLTSGTLTPQFLHLYPTWLGLFGLALGDAGLFYATPVLGWLGAVLAALTARRLFGPWVGTVTLLVLGLNSLQIWFVRQSLSEALLQFLMCAAAYGWAVGAGGWGPGTAEPPRRPGAPRGPAQPPVASPQPPPAPFFLALSGIAFGSLALAHAQFVFAFGLLPPLALWLWLSRRWRPAHWAFFGPILFLLAHASLHIGVFALGYFEGLYHHVLLDDLWPRRWLIGGGALVAAIGLGLLNRGRARWWPLLTHPAGRRLGPPALAAIVALTCAYSYLIRPGILAAALSRPGVLEGYIGAPVGPGVEGTMVRVGWYLSPLGMLLAGIGLPAIVGRLGQRLLVWLGLAAIFGLAFNLASFTHEGYIYSLRRFVPIVLPTLSIAIAYAVVVVVPGWLARLRPVAVGQRLGPAAGGLVLLALLAFFGVTGRTIIGHVEHAGAREQVAAIAARFAPSDLILFAGPRDEPHKLATPLRFVHGLDALVVSTNNPRGDLIEAWLSERMRAGRRVRVVLGNNGGKLLLPNYRLEPVGSLALTMTELERLAEQKPFNVQTNQIEYTLYDLVPASGAPLASLPFRYATGAGDELATVIGWYGREVDTHGTAFRWTNGDALLRLPWPPARQPMRLRLHLAGGVRPPRLGPARVELALARGQNDRAAPHLATLTLSEDFATYEVVVPPDLLPDSPTGTVMLALRNPGWQPSEHGLSYDPRLLGVRLAWLELTD